MGSIRSSMASYGRQSTGSIQARREGTVEYLSLLNPYFIIGWRITVSWRGPTVFPGIYIMEYRTIVINLS